MNVVTIIQARMGSTRLPGKVLMDIGGQTMLARVVRRASRATLVNQTVVATTTLSEDDVIVRECGSLGVFRGSPIDVLDRYCRAQRKFGADVIVRITADCPFIDPEVINHVVYAFLERDIDYASNTIYRSYPRGLDIEVMTSKALLSAEMGANQHLEREHVTPFIYMHPDRFRLYPVYRTEDDSDNRWTVDTSEDLAFARAVYSLFGNQDDFRWMDVLGALKDHPEIVALNAQIRQKSLTGGEKC